MMSDAQLVVLPDGGRNDYRIERTAFGGDTVLFVESEGPVASVGTAERKGRSSGSRTRTIPQRPEPPRCQERAR